MLEDVTERQMPISQYKSLLELAGRIRKKVQEANGELGGKLKSAAEDANLNLFAFGIIRRLDNQEVMKRKTNIAALRYQLDLAEENVWKEPQDDLLGKDAEGAAAEKKARTSAEKRVKDNETRLKEGIKPTKEPDKEKAARQRKEDGATFDVKQPNVTPLGGGGMPGAPIN